MIPNINLLPKKERRSSSQSLILYLFLIIIVIAIGFSVFQYITASRAIQAQQDEIELLQSEKIAIVEGRLKLENVKQNDIETSVVFLEHLSYPVSPLIVELNKYLDGNSYLRSYEFSAHSVTVSIDFETISEVSSYIEMILNSPFVEDVTVSQVSSFDPTHSDEERFDVVDRYSNTFEILIDLEYLRGVGGETR